MNQFVQDLLNVITGKQAPDFNLVLMLLVIYLALLWLAFCVWVFVDAKKRYDKMYKAILISLVVFVLNFPALIFYLVVRPEDEAAFVSQAHTSGVEVPVVRFVDANGKLKLALNLEIANQVNDQSDMTVSVAWDSQRQDIEISHRQPEIAVAVEAEEKGPKVSRLDKVKAFGKLFKRNKKVNTEEIAE